MNFAMIYRRVTNCPFNFVICPFVPTDFNVAYFYRKVTNRPPPSLGPP